MLIGDQRAAGEGDGRRTDREPACRVPAVHLSPSPEARLILDASATVPLRGGGPRSTSATVNVIDSRRFPAPASFTGGWSSGAYTLHYHGEFSRPALDFSGWSSAPGRHDRSPGPGTSTGGDTRENLANSLGTWATFDTRSDREVSMRLAVFFVSVEQARRGRPVLHGSRAVYLGTGSAAATAAGCGAAGRAALKSSRSAEQPTPCPLFHRALSRAGWAPETAR